MTAAGAGFADGWEAFFLPFFATWAHVNGGGIDVTRGGGGGGAGFAAGGTVVDPEASAGGGVEVRRGLNLWKLALAQYRVLLSFACSSSSAWGELRVHYNHSQRKNHNKFFAKLFSHWMKTPFFRLHPLIYRE